MPATEQQTAIHPLLQTLLDYGAEMETALRELNVDRFEDLVVARADLIEELKQHGPPSALDSRWHEVAQVYERQERIIMTEVARCQQALSDALASSARLNQASRVYRNDGGGGTLLDRRLSA